MILSLLHFPQIAIGGLSLLGFMFRITDGGDGGQRVRLIDLIIPLALLYCQFGCAWNKYVSKHASSASSLFTACPRVSPLPRLLVARNGTDDESECFYT